MKNIIYIAVAMIFVIGYLRYFEHKSLYFPTRDMELIPENAGLSYEEIYIDTEDGIKLNAWFIPREGSRYTVLFSHGNGGNISHRIEKILILNSLDFNIFIFDYRGYGKSKGHPSEKGFYIDARACYDYLVSKRGISPEEIILFGESLGGAVAVDLALQRKAKAIITESTFSNTQDVARMLYPFFPVFLISSRFDSTAKIKDVRIPKLIMHSKEDDIIPFSQSLKLYNNAPEPKRHLELVGDHNSCHIDSKDLYIAGIREFTDTL